MLRDRVSTKYELAEISGFGCTVAVAGLMLTIAWFFSWLAHPALELSLRFIAYVAAFNLLPGLAIIQTLVFERRLKIESVGTLLGLANLTGIVLNLAVVTLLWRAEQVNHLPLLPIASAIVLVAVCTRRGAQGVVLNDRCGAKHAALVLIFTAFFGVTALIGVANVLTGGNPDSYSFHHSIQGVIVRGLEHGYPPPNLILPDTHWSYNYGAHLWLLGAAQTAGIPIDALVARYGPLYFGGSAALAMLMAGRLMLGLGWLVASLAVVCVFWIVGYPSIVGRIFGTFMPAGATLILSPYLAIIIFVIGLFVFNIPTSRPKVWRVVLVVGLLFLLTGARGSAAPVAICALAFHVLRTAKKTGAIPYVGITDLLAAIGGFVLGLVFFFTVTSDFSGAGVVKVNGHPFGFLTSSEQYLLTLPHFLMESGVPQLLAGIISFLVIALFQAGFLAPFLATGLRNGMDTEERAVDLLFGSGLAGIVAFFMTEAPGYSHFSFLYFANISFALLGARGLQVILKKVDLGRCTVRPPNAKNQMIALAAGGLLVVVHLLQLSGPAMAWLIRGAPRDAAQLFFDPTADRREIVRCSRESDVGLVGRLESASVAPVVIFLPATPRAAFYCATIWLVVKRPIQGLSDYLLIFIPGRASGALGDVLTARAKSMQLALGHAASGMISVADVKGIKNTLSAQADVYLLADGELVPDMTYGLALVDENDRYKLWRVGE